MPLFNELLGNTTISWCRILKHAQLLSLSRKIPQFYRKDYYRIREYSLLDFTLNQFNPVHALTASLMSHFNVILRFHTKILHNFSVFLCMLYAQFI
jgi:hypothetical protein